MDTIIGIICEDSVVVVMIARSYIQIDHSLINWSHVEYQDNCQRYFNLKEHSHISDILLTTPFSTEYSKYRDCIWLDHWKIPSKILLSKEASDSLNIINAGGKSNVSEALSIQYFLSVFGGTDFVYEKQIDYYIHYKMVDFICTLPNLARVGVSVTRAMKFPRPERFTLEDAHRLLQKKLYGLIVARNAVNRRHAFYRSVLHVWCQTPRIADLLQEAYNSLDINDYGLDIQGVVVLLLTVCENPAIYRNKRSIFL